MQHDFRINIAYGKLAEVTAVTEKGKALMEKKYGFASTGFNVKNSDWCLLNGYSVL